MRHNIAWITIETHNDYIWRHIAREWDYYEIDYLKFSQERVGKKEWVILDIWANIWNHSQYRARKWNDVIAFEPSPDNYELLVKNTDKYEITIHQIALLDREAPFGIKVNQNNRGWDKIKKIKDDWRQEIMKTKTLDSMYFPEIKLIKVDVEWVELQVLKWWEKTIKLYKPDLMVEVNDDEVFQYILQLGYVKLFSREKNKTVYFTYQE